MFAHRHALGAAPNALRQEAATFEYRHTCTRAADTPSAGWVHMSADAQSAEMSPDAQSADHTAQLSLRLALLPLRHVQLELVAW